MSEIPRTPEARDTLVLRDELAIDRTVLANERTLLAYLRAGVALLIAGASILHFSIEGWFRLIGLVCLPIGLLASLVGAVRYRRMHRKITRARGRVDFGAERPGR